MTSVELSDMLFLDTGHEIKRNAYEVYEKNRLPFEYETDGQDKVIIQATFELDLTGY